MSSKLLSLILFAMGLFLFCSIIFGFGTSNIIMATIFMLAALVFTFRSDFYYKYLEFINPKLYESYNSKGREYLKKLRKNTMKFLYMLSLIMYFNGFVNNSFSIRNTYNIGFNFYILLGVIILILTFASSYINTNLKSKIEKGKYAKISFFFNLYMTCMLITAIVIFWFAF